MSKAFTPTVAPPSRCALGDIFEHRDEAAIGGAERNNALIGPVSFANDVNLLKI
jgi:hypothetical protein